MNEVTQRGNASRKSKKPKWTLSNTKGERLAKGAQVQEEKGGRRKKGGGKHHLETCMKNEDIAILQSRD